MPTDPKVVRDLLLAAAELPGAKRATYLNAQCGDDVELRAAAERLLAAHDQPAAVLDRPVSVDLQAARKLPTCNHTTVRTN